MERTRNIQDIVNTVLKGIAVAMAVAVVILNILKTAPSLDTQVMLLGIGLTCLAILALQQK